MPQPFGDSEQQFGHVDTDAVRCVYTSVGVNRQSGCCDMITVGGSEQYSYSLLAFGASHNVCLASLSENENAIHTEVDIIILRMLSGHTAPVLSLRWIRSHALTQSSKTPFLASADHHGKVNLWRCKQDSLISNRWEDRLCDWYCLKILDLPEGAIPTSVDGFLMLNPSDHAPVHLVLDVAADSAFYSWYIELTPDSKAASNSVNCNLLRPTVTSLGRSLALCLRSFPFSVSSSIFYHFVLVGTDTGLIELWSEAFSMSSELTFSPPLESSVFTRSAGLSGHTDWVRCLAVHRDVSQPNSCIFIASGGQDNVIRLWRLYQTVKFDRTDASTHAKVCDICLPSSKASCDLNLTVASESVLSGHTNWITGLAWTPSTISSPPMLLSCSMDKSLTVWSPPKSESRGLWIECTRLGNIGGAGLGFLDCLWSPSEKCIFGLSFQGNLSVWCRTSEDSFWSPSWPLCGHHGPVTDISWCPPSGHINDQLDIPFRLLLTAGSDQTVRAHAPRLPSRAVNKTHASQGRCSVWQELARTQLHGYDMNAVAGLSPISYVSAGDEKVARVFKATRTFVDTYLHATGTDHYPMESLNLSTPFPESLPEGATQPTLGLSNQAAVSAVLGENQQVESSPGLPNACDRLLHPPTFDNFSVTEDRLQHLTLWPETKKLYGHPYEVFCLAAHPLIPLVASACTASKPCHAYVILWDGSSDWSIHQRLFHHQLTVTQMSWSHNGDHLLAVSRDRTWSVWSAGKDKHSHGGDISSPPTYELTACPLKGHSHSRIIWTGAWTPDDCCFLTGSRDKNILVWPTPPLKSQSSVTMCKPLDAKMVCSHAVTALDVCFLSSKQSPSVHTTYLVAVGLETGTLLLAILTRSSHSSTNSEPELAWSNFLSIPACWSHVPDKRVRRVAFEPAGHNTQTFLPSVCLATAADDGIVHVYEIDRPILAIRFDEWVQRET